LWNGEISFITTFELVTNSFNFVFMLQISFLDTEVDPKTGKILDIGGTNDANEVFHDRSVENLQAFISKAQYICGHNIIDHDKKYLSKWWGEDIVKNYRFIDTLYISPLLYPERPYHHLVKDDKLDPENLNNPYIDAVKAKDLFYDELEKFRKADSKLQQIYFRLLNNSDYFKSFFDFVTTNETEESTEQLIRGYFTDMFCSNSDLSVYVSEDPVSLAYALALITCNSRESITPPWVLHRFPNVERILFQLRSEPCLTGCAYCDQSFDAKLGLREFFGFPSYRTFDGKPLQEEAVDAALHNKSILAIFPTGGGKSLTYQVPALMAGKNSHALTVIISPLQSLMKDQVDNLMKKDITDAVTINGLLDPVERAKSIERVKEGVASILYISPESLRSKTIENLLLGRKIARFVIDEAHCFSSWGHDFRVDYLYIGDFLKHLQIKKKLPEPIPVSCFTATAKPQVIDDINKYFNEKLDLELVLFHSSSGRKNLQYQVINCTDEKEKYLRLRDLTDAKGCPTIVFVSRVRKAVQIAKRLSEDGYKALPYHGKMDSREKTFNQNSFMSGETDIIVATSAFGMGVDKDNVGMVVHFDISDSLENYVQEAGRAGRDESITADCFVLFNEDDLGKHFILLNQTKIDIHEIQEIWKAIKKLPEVKGNICNSALEIARKAGWNEQVDELETRVTTAVAALEEAGYLKRIHNSPRIFATSILAKNADEAIDKINASARMNQKQKEQGIRIIKMLIGSRSRHKGTDEVAESRVDYISDLLGIKQKEVNQAIELLVEEGVLADTKDLTVSVSTGQTEQKTMGLLEKYARLENVLYEQIADQEQVINIKKINEFAESSGIDSSPNNIRTILNFWATSNWIKKEKKYGANDHLKINYSGDRDKLAEKIRSRHALTGFIVKYLFNRMMVTGTEPGSNKPVYIEFSIHELKKALENQQSLFKQDVSIYDIEEALLFLVRIEALTIEGGFLVVYNRLNIQRKERNQLKQYKKEDYDALKTHYDHKTQQIHIVGEYAKKMLKDYQSALTFVDDYFSLNYSSFLKKYFPGSRQDDICKTITVAQFKKLFGELTPGQLDIVNNKDDQYLVVAAGPGSGKTKLLVHKLASIVRMEDVKYEHLLMLTFSRAAVSEFKQRLINLIGGAAQYIEIKTFHSFCFDLMGRVGDVDKSRGIIKEALKGIMEGSVEQSRIAKSVLVIDEAQDMHPDEHALISQLMENNPEMRVIAVGDDDQNIYEFRGSDSRYFREFTKREGARQFELIENFRSKPNLVTFANVFARQISARMKSTEIVSRHKENGVIRIFRHYSDNLEIPLVKEIMQAELRGTTCVLTYSNSDATQLAGMLKQKGIPAKLIQSNDRFDLLKMRESRFLFKQLGVEDGHRTVTDEQLETIERKLQDQFGSTISSEILIKAIGTFRKLHPKTKYRSDLEIFLQESQLEDFIESDRDTIIVSTMHKAKGREFDNVYLMLNHYIPDDDAKRRLLYVAMTRAKSMLEIHYNDDYLAHIQSENIIRLSTDQNYPKPSELLIQLTHKDIQLGYFGFIQRRIFPLNSGDQLGINEEGCVNKKGELVLKFSAHMGEKLSRLCNEGYKPVEAHVVFIVNWYSEEKGEEYLLALPELKLERVDKRPLD
jgi:ATP-dependent DNA helicase RecQ